MTSRLSGSLRSLRTATILSLLLCGLAARAQTYTAHHLPMPAGFTGGFGNATTATGSAQVGTVEDAAGIEHAALWTASGITVLPDYSAVQNQASGIDAAGNVYGWVYAQQSGGSFGNVAVEWPGGGAPIALPDPTGIIVTKVRGAAPNGTAVGEASNAAGMSPIVWPNGLPSLLADPVGYTICSGAATNNSGMVAGFCTDSTWSYNRGVLWIQGYATVLPKLSGGDSASANAINASGVVAGAGKNSAGQEIGLVWTNGVITKLPQLAKGTYAAASSINTAGLVGGQSDGGSVKANRHAVLWSPPYSAPTELPTPAGDTACYLMALDDAGNAVGYCLNTAAANFLPTRWTH